jgi:alpha-tubulin suppressor-like RCC1 family protein
MSNSELEASLFTDISSVNQPVPLIYNMDLLAQPNSITNLLLIDRAVPSYQTFIDSANSTTFPVAYSWSSSKSELLTLLQGVSSIERIGFVFEAHGSSSQMFLDNKPFFIVNEVTPYSENLEWLLGVIRDFGVKNVDFLACNSLNMPEYNAFYGILLKETGVVVGASNDATGNIKYGGDWVMESTMEDIEMVYFKESIEYYKYLLGTSSLSSINTFLIASDMTVYGTGDNVFGQLCNGTNSYSKTLINIANTTGKTPLSVVACFYHTIVLMTDGTIYCCGDNSSGQLGTGNTNSSATLTLMINTTGKTPSSIYGIGRINYSSTIVLMTDGTIYGCGDNSSGRLGTGNTNNSDTLTLMINTTGKTPSSISCGDRHTIVLMTDGTIYGCGVNFDGQLGKGNTTDTTTLTLMTNTTGKTPSSINCGLYHTVVLMTDGTIYGCGNNSYGQLGTGNDTSTTTLTLMTNTTGKTPSSISCMDRSTVVLMTDGTIYGCGENLGWLGTGTGYYYSLSLRTNTTGKTPSSIGCQLNCIIVLMTDGTIYGCGSNSYGQLGTGNTTNTTTLTLMTNTTGKTPSSISCGLGGYCTRILMSDGSIYGCGLSNVFQLGYGPNTSYKQITNNTGFLVIDIIVGSNGGGFLSGYIILLMSNGKIYGCGSNLFGQLGTGNTTNTTTLTLMTNTTGKKPTAIYGCSNYSSHTIVLMDDGTIYGCGNNFNGQLGTGNTTDTTTLTLMTNTTGKKPTAISCMDRSTVVLMTDGTIYGCGYNTDGQLGTGNNTSTNLLTLMTNTTGKTPSFISCGNEHTVILMTDGTIYGCGNNSKGQLGTGNTSNYNILTLMTNTTGKTPLFISCGNEHTVILMTDGTIYGCGNNSYGQLGTGNNTSTTTLTLMINLTGKTPTSICMAGNSTQILMSDGTVYTCGINNYGQLGTGNTSNYNILTSIDTTFISPKTIVKLPSTQQITASQFKNAGYTALELKNAGYTTLELKNAGYTLLEVINAGYTTLEVINAGYTASQLKNAGYSDSEILAAGFTSSQLKVAGYTSTQLYSAGYNANQVQAAGYADWLLLTPNSNVIKQSYFNGFLDISGTTLFRQDISMNGPLTVSSNTVFPSDVSMNSRLYVSGNTTINGNLNVNSILYANFASASISASAISGSIVPSFSTDIIGSSRLIVTNDVSFNSRLQVFGDVSLNGALQTTGNIIINTINPASFYNIAVNTWTPNTSAPTGYNWSSISMSSNGQYQISTDSNSSVFVYTSSNYGSTWNTFNINNLFCVYTAVSSSGQYQFVFTNTSSNNGTIYISSNYGSTFVSSCTNTGSSFPQYAVSDNGQYIYTKLLYSTNYGASYSPTSGIIGWDSTVNSIAVSYNGQYVSTGSISTNNVYISSDYGVTFSSSASYSSSIANNSIGTVYSLSMSSSGQYQSLVTLTTTAGNYSIWTSTNYGNLWTFNTSAAYSTSIQWNMISVSSAGNYQVASRGDGYIYVSSNYGSTWNTTLATAASWSGANSTGTSNTWNGLAISSSGQYLSAVTYGGQIFTSISTLLTNNKLNVSNTTTVSNVDTALNSRLFVKNIESDVSMNGNLTISGNLTTNNLNSLNQVNKSNFVGNVTVNGNIYSGLNSILFKDVSMNSQLYVNGNIYTNKSVYASSGQLSTSDYRIKENVVKLDSSYTIDHLDPFHYYNKLIDKEDLGLIAHQLQESYPMLVTGEKDGEEYQRVNYIGLIPILIKELQELKQKIKTRNEQLDQLERHLIV